MEKGLVRAIGISNFTITKTANLLKTAKITPAINQGRLINNLSIHHSLPSGVSSLSTTESIAGVS